MGEMFNSKVRTKGDLAGVFEYDGDTAYFYLYRTSNENGKKIIDAIHILTGIPEFDESDIKIDWDQKETKVGLFIFGKLWAVFDSDCGCKYGGNYHIKSDPNIPKNIIGNW